MKTNFRAIGALMLGLSLGGGLLTTAHAAPANGNPQANPAAQAGKAGKREGKGMKMMQELNLTDAQKQQLMPIMKDTREQMKALRQNTTLSEADKKAKVKALHQSSETKINAILTPAQQQKLAQLKAQRKAQGGDKGGKRGQNRQPLPPVPAT